MNARRRHLLAQNFSHAIPQHRYPKPVAYYDAHNFRSDSLVPTGAIKKHPEQCSKQGDAQQHHYLNPVENLVTTCARQMDDGLTEPQHTLAEPLHALQSELIVVPRNPAPPGPHARNPSEKK